MSQNYLLQVLSPHNRVLQGTKLQQFFSLQIPSTPSHRDLCTAPMTLKSSSGSSAIDELQCDRRTAQGHKTLG
jgi:hypothetical protein